DAIAAGLGAFTTVPGRLALTGAPDGPAVVDDTYNANPVSVAAGLSAAVAMAQGRPLVLVLGDMKELGELAAEMHRQTGLLAAQAGCRLVVALGEHAEDVAQGAREGGLSPDQTLIFAAMDELLNQIAQLLDARDLVLVKGSRSMAMERVVARLGGGQGGAH
ncbi:MAG: hypothetical protein K9K36_14960, partial [Desulfarculaceae bacterium]|nr:hypothetical protein [Desulfarculaceae bacterium]